MTPSALIVKKFGKYLLTFVHICKVFSRISFWYYQRTQPDVQIVENKFMKNEGHMLNSMAESNTMLAFSNYRNCFWRVI